MIGVIGASQSVTPQVPAFSAFGLGLSLTALSASVNMANEAEKKAARRRGLVWKYYGGCVALATVAHIVLHMFLFKRSPWELLSGFWHLIGLILIGIAYFVCIQGKLSEANAGTDGEVWLDLFAVTVVTHIAHLWTKWAWLGLAVYPVYGLVRLWGFVKPWIQQYQTQQLQAAIHQAAANVNKEEKVKRKGGQVVYQKQK